MRLPEHIRERPLPPNAFAAAHGEGHERLQNVHNDDKKHAIYFSTFTPGGSYYSHSAHHRPIVHNETRRNVFYGHQ